MSWRAVLGFSEGVSGWRVEKHFRGVSMGLADWLLWFVVVERRVFVLGGESISMVGRGSSSAETD